MSWNRLLQPDLVLGGPIVNLTPEILQQHDLKGLILDVDETLVPLNVTSVSAELEGWVKDIKSVATLSMVSNNLNRLRISSIAESLDLPYKIGAAKPSRRKLRQAVEEMKLPVERVAMVGDRLFTDVLAGNRLGLFTVLVEPMVYPGQTDQFYPTRSFEIWLSQSLGASLAPVTPKFTNRNRL